MGKSGKFNDSIEDFYELHQKRMACRKAFNASISAFDNTLQLYRVSEKDMIIFSQKLRHSMEIDRLIRELNEVEKQLIIQNVTKESY
jgi:hypothetical protein